MTDYEGSFALFSFMINLLLGEPMAKITVPFVVVPTLINIIQWAHDRAAGRMHSDLESASNAQSKQIDEQLRRATRVSLSRETRASLKRHVRNGRR